MSPTFKKNHRNSREMAECQELRGAIPRTNLEEVTKVTLWKTTIVIWSDRDPSGYELVDLARDATDGNSKCSKCATKVVDKPEADPDFSGVGQFFGTEEIEAPQGEHLAPLRPDPTDNAEKR